MTWHISQGDGWAGLGLSVPGIPTARKSSICKRGAGEYRGRQEQWTVILKSSSLERIQKLLVDCCPLLAASGISQVKQAPEHQTDHLID